tara:strand:+ start:637 stop:1485 length:849 start_codon:yes stop_codon:yes gene_type:complete
MKLALGTVQFGMNYGINNQVGSPSDKNIYNILNFAFKNGIKTLDTAVAYGNSQKRLGEILKNEFQIISKFSGVYNFRDLENELLKSLSLLKINLIYGFMFHNADELIENPKMWNFLKKLKASNKIKKIGFSIYNEKQLNTILDLGIIPDIVQLPYSILDRRLENSLIKLKLNNVEVHVRSVFLQGLYFKDVNNLPKNLLPLRSNLKKMHGICKSNNIKMSTLALNFVKQNKNIDKIVIGADSPEQIIENIESMNYNLSQDIIKLLYKINVVEKKLLNPVNWN